MGKRPKISVYIAMSIDGYIARRDNSLDWLDRVGGFDEDYGFQQLINSIDSLIIGRKTYEVASTASNPYPGKRVIVLSNSLSSVREGMELYNGDLTALIKKLHTEGVSHIWIDGGVTISQFLSLKMVDNMTLSIIPIILGTGLPLFNLMNKEIPCRLISSRSYSSGLIQLNYEIIKQFTSKKDKIIFKVIDYGSSEYKKSVALRKESSGEPVGLFTDEELKIEKNHIHIAGFLGEELCAAAVLILEQRECKMQQVAIKTQFQNMGIGSALIAFCEKYAKKKGFKTIYCHSRGISVPFYLKNKYLLEGEFFDEGGIPYCKMKKSINNCIDESLNTRICSTSHDNEIALQFRQMHFFDQRDIQDPYTWTVGHKNHEHFLLEKHDTVIGYAHIQHWINHRAALRIIVIEKQEQGNGYGRYLMDYCERILKEKGIDIFQMEAHPSAVKFYQHLGYIEMPFNDPDGHPTDKNDTPMGKIL